MEQNKRLISKTFVNTTAIGEAVYINQEGCLMTNSISEADSTDSHYAVYARKHEPVMIPCFDNQGVLQARKCFKLYFRQESNSNITGWEWVSQGAILTPESMASWIALTLRNINQYGGVFSERDCDSKEFKLTLLTEKQIMQIALQYIMYFYNAGNLHAVLKGEKEFKYFAGDAQIIEVDSQFVEQYKQFKNASI